MDIVKVEESVVVETGCDHSPVAIEFRFEYGVNQKGEQWPYKAFASRFACWKCKKLLPLDLKHLVIGK